LQFGAARAESGLVAAVHFRLASAFIGTCGFGITAARGAIAAQAHDRTVDMGQ
jgi:hypothetical protein